MPRLTTERITFRTILKIGGIILLVTTLLGYAGFQARNLINGPTIELTGAYTVIQHERSIKIQGVAKNIVKLTLNGREIHTDKNGTFSEQVVLENGLTTMTLEAFDRFGRKTDLTRTYVFKPSEGA